MTVTKGDSHFSRKDLLMIGLLFVAALYCFGDWFFKREIVIFRDLHHYFYPLRQYTVQCFKQGIFPWWNPYIMLGTPHFASMQFVVLYPLSLLYFVGDFAFSFNLFIWVHLFLTAVFAYFFFRELKFSPLASAWGAFSWMMSGYLVSAINLLNILGSVIWIPLVLLFFRRLLIRKNRRYSVWTAAALVLMFLGSEAAITIMTIWILLGYALVYGWNNGDVILRRPPKGDRRRISLLKTRFFASLRMTARSWLPTITLFIGLAAFQWIPSIEYLLQTERNQIDFVKATVWSVPPWDLLNLWFPFITDPWIPKQDYWIRQSLFASYYAGSLPWVFGVWLLRWRRTEFLKWILTGLAVSLIPVLGRFTPLYQFLHDWIPGFSWLRYPVRLFFIPTFLLCWLLAYGLDRFRGQAPNSSQEIRQGIRGLAPNFCLKISLGFGLLMLAAGYPPVLDWVRDLFPRYEGKEILFVRIALSNLWRTLSLWVVSWLLLWGLIRFPRFRRLGLTGLSLVLFWDLAGVHKGINNTISVREFLKSASSVEFLKQQEGYFRICPSPKLYTQQHYLPSIDFSSAITGSFEACVPDRLVPFGIADAAGYDSIYLERYGKLLAALMTTKTPEEHQLYHLLNVRFLGTPEPIPKEQKTFRLAYQSEHIYLYENRKFLPRVFWVPKAVFMSDPEEILEQIKDPGFRPTEEVILEKGPGPKSEIASTDFVNLAMTHEEPITSSAQIQKYTPNCVEISAQTGTPQFLVLSDAYYPGWRATLDGKEIPVFRADYYLRAVRIPAGSHLVRFFYHPWWFFPAPVVSLITLMACVPFVGLDRRRRMTL